MPTARALSSPSGAAKEDDVVEWSGAIFVIKFWSVTKKYDEKCDEKCEENTDGTSDIGDYVNSSLDLE